VVHKEENPVHRLIANRERNPLLVIVGRAASPDLELSMTGFVPAGQIDAFVVPTGPFDGSVSVDLELLVLASGITFPDLDFGAVCFGK
jgi:hypothetical protein